MAGREAQGGGEGIIPRDAPAAAGPDSPTQPTSDLEIGRLIDDHHQPLFRYAYRLTGSTADAEDLTQQTFLIVHQKISQVRQPERISGWLYSVLRSCFLKSRRKRRPTPVACLELEIDELPAELPAESPAASDAEPFDRHQLQAALDELPDEARLILVMFYFEECSYKEIAQHLQIELGTVMSRLSRAKARLRGSLLKYEPADDLATRRNRPDGPMPVPVTKITSQRIPFPSGPPGNTHAT